MLFFNKTHGMDKPKNDGKILRACLGVYGSVQAIAMLTINLFIIFTDRHRGDSIWKHPSALLPGPFALIGITVCSAWLIMSLRQLNKLWI